MEYKFCIRCGSPMQNGICPTCGFQHEEADHSVSGKTPYRQPYVGTPHRSEKDNQLTAKIIVGIVAAIAVLSAILSLVYFTRGIHVQVIRPWSNGRNQLQEYLEGHKDSMTPEEAEENYIPSAEDEYYVTIADSIREDLSYSVRKETYHFEDNRMGSSAVGSYIIVDGRIPNLDKLNDRLQKESHYFADILSAYAMQQMIYKTYQVSCESYVTYMDEDKLSIVLNHRMESADEGYVFLSCINVDVKSGEVLDNDSLMEYSAETAQEFRRQSDYQNGPVEFLDEMDDETLLDYLSDPDINIAFYTPVGLEIGFNYDYGGQYSGWITATRKEGTIGKLWF